MHRANIPPMVHNTLARGLLDELNLCLMLDAPKECASVSFDGIVSFEASLVGEYHFGFTESLFATPSSTDSKEGGIGYHQGSTRQTQ